MGNRGTAMILGGLLFVGLFYVGSAVFLGALIFAGFWATMHRMPLAMWITRRAPLLVDAFITITTYGSLALLGVASTQIWLATITAGLISSIWVSLVSDAYRRQKRGVTASDKTRENPDPVNAVR